MSHIFRCALALTLGACTVPSFGIAPDPVADDPVVTDPVVTDPVVDACTAQTVAGKVCGGECPACANGGVCSAPADCASGLCDGGVCVAVPTCSDGQTNGGETDIDCGGPCTACPLNEHCTHDSDCTSYICDNLSCAAPAPVAASCSDGLKNDTESDIDCGGSCAQCAVNKRCGAGSDCTTLVCASVCQPPSCADGVRNGGESDKDCGGSCAACAVGAVCTANSDCKSASCASGHCIAANCSDTIKNNDETGTDCGGSCSTCAAGQGCLKGSDCQSLICSASKACAAASCSDGVKNASESEIDCGKGCAGCASGLHCNENADCASALCKSTYCVPKTASGGVLMTTGWTATASDTYSSSAAPAFAFDNKPTTDWSSGKSQYSGMWFAFDMKAQKIFFGLTLDVQNQPSDTPALFDVYLSLDGTFTTPTLKSVPGASSGLTEVTFNGAQLARYVKLVLTNGKVPWWGIRELSVNY